MTLQSFIGTDDGWIPGTNGEPTIRCEVGHGSHAISTALCGVVDCRCQGRKVAKCILMNGRKRPPVACEIWIDDRRAHPLLQQECD